MDVSAIASAYNGVKAAKDVFSAVLQLKIDNESMLKVNEALRSLGDVQDNLFALREQLSELQSKNQELTQKLAERERWEQKLAGYKIEETPGGAVVYASMNEPRHYACPSCISKQQLHILQDSRVMAGTFECPGCKFNFPVLPRRSPPPARALNSGIV
ncbi:MAG: hypothetical protein E6G78_21255 [Alphaproteobacteria bacterium]|nr:MAG: hypothetical protein E6G78_21255 [Alphaproteobacteria bacterium]